MLELLGKNSLSARLLRISDRPKILRRWRCAGCCVGGLRQGTTLIPSEVHRLPRPAPLVSRLRFGGSVLYFVYVMLMMLMIDV